MADPEPAAAQERNSDQSEPQEFSKVSMTEAATPDAYHTLAGFIRTECEKRLRAYEAQPRDVTEHFETENDVLSGSYAYRQLYELIQNAADAILEAGDGAGRIEIRLAPDMLEAANTGAALNEAGIVALLNARSSSKRGSQIGRFGIGFKSLLKLNGKVDLWSRTAGLSFDPALCRSTIRDRLSLPEDARVPAMRLARPLDPAHPDAPLAPGGRYPWATTVVTAALNDEVTFERLAQEIGKFPAEFLLFLPAEIELVLHVEGGIRREISKYIDNGIAHVFDGSTETRWRLFETRHRISDPAAREDATHIQGRDDVPLAWAVPLDGREQSGRFWAFFPTDTPTFAAGILNAPWKLNSDRSNLIRGPWNDEIMKAAAALIVRSLPALSTEEDRGGPLSAFPRQPDRQEDLAMTLVTALWDQIMTADVLPDATGSLRPPSGLRRPPLEDAAAIRRWTGLADESAQRHYLHPDCFRLKTRVSRLRALDEEAKRRGAETVQTADIAEWLEALATPHTARMKGVLEFVRDLLPGGALHGSVKYINQSRIQIVPVSDGGFAAPPESVITDGKQTPAGFRAVHPDYTADPESRQILTDTLHVSVLAEEAWSDILETSFYTADYEDTDLAWDAFWTNFSACPSAAAREFILQAETEKLKFRNLGGTFSPRGLLVVAGDDDGYPDDFRLDTAYHHSHRPRLPATTFSFLPETWETVGPSDEGLRAYVAQFSPLAHAEISARSTGSRPQADLIVLDGGQSMRRVAMPSGWRLLSALPGHLREAVTLHIIAETCKAMLGRRPVRFRHQSRQDHYASITAPHPALWIVAGKGSIGAAPFPALLSSIPETTAKHLSRCRAGPYGEIASLFEAMAEPTDLTGSFSWPRTQQDAETARQFWADAFGRIAASDLPRDALTELIEAAARQGFVPEVIPTPAGPLKVSEMYVTSDPAQGLGVSDPRILILSAETCMKWTAAGAQPLSGTPKVSYTAQRSMPRALTDVFPELGSLSDFSDLAAELPAVWVTGLRKEVGPAATDVMVAFDQDNTLLIDRDRFAARPWHDAMSSVIEIIGTGTGQNTDASALARLLDHGRTDAARRAVRARPDLSDKLTEILNGDPQPLLRGFPPATRAAIPPGTSPQEIAGLALAMHGPALLARLRNELTLKGLAPPDRWGGAAAIEFVSDLGFPKEFATGTGARREAELRVSGPVALPELHDYQKSIIQNMADLIHSGSDRRRAIVSLPTGGGKTRVAAEAVVRLVLNSGTRRTALWVAQTDELCEQAVQCFRQLWMNIGVADDDLRIVRLWGGQRNPAEPEDNEPVVVVACIDTLSSRASQGALEWLKDSGIVVIDECHHAISPSYTELFRWLDIQVGHERPKAKEPPVIGLSATPWRGFSDEESIRLAGRFDRRWFPADQEGLHRQLSDMGVLASRTYRALRYDRQVRLSANEERHFEKFGELPAAVSSRIGEDEARNNLIIDEILNSNARSILLFANSVAHAQHLAVRLHLAGCPAAAVSGETDKLARQHFTNRFRAGEIRVICNHSVLTTGFDAPRADMIFISRPVFSPVLYMQMVGRGLRGPANGGTAHCEIVTVEDNIANHKDALAFHYCKRFFSS